MACSRIPKCRIRPAGFGVQALVDHFAGTKDPPPSMVVLLDSARSAEPPQSSGITSAMAFRTFPEAALVASSSPAVNSGSASTMFEGSSDFKIRSNSFAASGLASCQSANCWSQSLLAEAPLSTSFLVWVSTSSDTWKLSSGSKPRASFKPASSSAPSLEPWIFPVFCLVGLGHPIIVFRVISVGCEVFALAFSIAS